MVRVDGGDGGWSGGRALSVSVASDAASGVGVSIIPCRR